MNQVPKFSMIFGFGFCIMFSREERINFKYIQYKKKSSKMLMLFSPMAQMTHHTFPAVFFVRLFLYLNYDYFELKTRSKLKSCLKKLLLIQKIVFDGIKYYCKYEINNLNTTYLYFPVELSQLSFASDLSYTKPYINLLLLFSHSQTNRKRQAILVITTQLGNLHNIQINCTR